MGPAYRDHNLYPNPDHPGDSDDHQHGLYLHSRPIANNTGSQPDAHADCYAGPNLDNRSYLHEYCGAADRYQHKCESPGTHSYPDTDAYAPAGAYGNPIRADLFPRDPHRGE